MTATFSDKYIRILERMTGVSVLDRNIFWCNNEGMSRRNVQIIFSFTGYHKKHTKHHLGRVLAGNNYKMAIFFHNSAKAVTVLKEDVDLWLDETDKFTGDTVLITGGMASEIKFEVTSCFTSDHDVEELLREDIFYPRVLFGVDRCMNAGIDTKHCHLVVRVGYPKSLANALQELSRAGRSRVDTGELVDFYSMCCDFGNFVYLCERAYTVDPENPYVESVMSITEHRSLVIEDLLGVIRLSFLNNGCWHLHLENMFGRNNDQSRGPCNKVCPFCNKEISEYVKPVNRVGLTKFLCYTFIQNPVQDLTPARLVSQLRDYPDIGVVVFKRKTKKSFDKPFLDVLVLQLIASGIIELQMEESEKVRALCKLSVGDNMSPVYLNNDVWTRLYLI